MDQQEHKLTYWRILVFWLPLAATWVMMSLEGPFLSAIIARMAEPKFNLAAYGVASSIVFFFEAPIIMIMSAATALVRDRDSFVKLRNFTYVLCGLVTAGMALGLLPAVFSFLAGSLIGLPEDVARLTHLTAILMLPWPGAIGYRRLYQGLLIRHNRTRNVAYGTVIRLVTMAASGLFLHLFTPLAGAFVGAAAMSVGVTFEAVAARLMARNVVRGLLSEPIAAQPAETTLTYRSISQFYYPLALTSILALGIRPMVIFFVGQSRMGLESLAVLPVIHTLLFLFLSLGLSFQEAAIVLLGERHRHYLVLRNFAWGLGLATAGGLALVGFTPVSALWFHHVSGLSLELTEFAALPVQIMAFLPGFSVLLFFQRAVLLNARLTQPITWATGLEVAVIAAVLLIGIHFLDAVGAVAAAAAMLLGRLAANALMFPPFFKALGQRA